MSEPFEYESPFDGALETPCKCCGAPALTCARELMQTPEGDCEVSHYACTLCGDNWTSSKWTIGARCTITFVHNQQMHPVLSRRAQMSSRVVLSGEGEAVEQQWDHYIGPDRVDAQTWLRRLATCRDELKGRIAN